MKNIYVIPNNEEDIPNILTKDIKGIIIGVEDLSIYNLELDINKIIKVSNNTNKEVIIAMNKMIHNKDLPLIYDILTKINNSNIKGILFYDVCFLKIAKDLNITKELILGQEHLNASISSNLFYKKRGVTSSFITSDITYNEILDIKKETKMNIFYTVYGYLPIFYSKRKLLTNYFKYINKEMTDSKYYIFNNNLKYMIKERNYGTLIYSPLVNLINDIDKLTELNLVIDLSYTENIDIIDIFINKEVITDTYKGFFNTKTIYKLKDGKNE